MFWLASYPKSGNTWIRVFLTNLIIGGKGTFNINQLMKTYFANDNQLIEHFTPFEPSELTFQELENVRKRLFHQLPKLVLKESCVKIHHANQLFQLNESLLSDLSQKVIYVVRNPLDVVISLAYHQQWSIDQSIEFLNNNNAIMGNPTKLNQRMSADFLSSWSRHYRSWKVGYPECLVIRYEDMLENEWITFSSISKYLGFSFTKGEINEAIIKSKIGLLQKQEAKTRFKEGSIVNQNFFRKGISGEWKSILTPEQIERIVSRHGLVMEELNYL
ncbi:sulfotransferase domain-containing protein [bacterium]|jgi:hypothetical protein|nr:sulfotransferase domain-containing protein [bacterium]